MITTLSHADVLWAIIPIQNVDGEVGVDQDDIIIVKQYIVDTLNMRKSRGDSKPLSIAIVITKADAATEIDGTMEDARPALTRITKQVADKFANLVRSQMVRTCSAFPVTAVGFGNASAIAQSAGTMDFTKYVLAGTDFDPWNVDHLLMWSLAHGFEQTLAQNRFRHGNTDLADRLFNGFQQADGPMLELKRVPR